MKKNYYKVDYRPLFEHCVDKRLEEAIKYYETEEKLRFVKTFGGDPTLFDYDEDDGELDYYVELIVKKTIYEYSVGLRTPSAMEFSAIKESVEADWFGEKQMFLRLLAAAEMAS